MDGKQKPKKKFYFGWWIVVVGFLIMAFSFAPSQSLPGLFIKPIADEFGVSRTVSATVQSSVTLAIVLGSLVAGRFFSRRSIRVVVAGSLALQAACNFLIANSGVFWLLYVAGIGRGVAVAFGTTLPAAYLVNNWFGGRIRGRVWGITAVGSGVGAMVLTPIVGAIMENLGWRSAYSFFGILSLVLIPLVLLVYVRHPADKGLEPIGQPDATVGGLRPDDSGIPAKRALRSSVLWLVMGGGFLLAGSTQIWNINGAAYLADLDYDIMFVSFLVTLCSIGLTVGKVLLGAISDRFGTRTGMIFGCAMCVAGYLLVLLAGTPFVAYPAMVLLGIGLASPTVMIPLVTRDLFGNRDYATLSGITQAGGSLGAGLLSLGGSLIYELTGGYLTSWVIACIFSVSTVLLVFIAYRLQPALMKRRAATKAAL